MKRVIISLLLLAIVFLMSGSFTPGLNDPIQPALSNSYTSSGVASPQPFAHNFLPSAEVAGDVSGYPAPGLVLLAALASSLAMAIFIFGSRFIAILIAG